MAGIKGVIDKSPCIFLLAALLSGFIAGVGAYEGLLRITNQETVIRNSYILKGTSKNHPLCAS